MEWARILAYATGTVDQELRLRNEYLAAENRILRAQLNGCLRLSDAERATLGEIGFRLGRKALSEVATVAQPDTILASFPGQSAVTSSDQSNSLASMPLLADPDW
jgi:putative transposase